jgi:hypothetical protein
MPSADFCSAVRPPFDSLSPLRTRSRSPGVSSTAFRAQPPDLRFAPLMDMDFAVSRPLVRHSRLISDFCSSTRTFAIRFFQTPPRGGGPCVLARPSPPSGWPEDLHLQTAEHAQHTTKPAEGWRSAQKPKSFVGFSFRPVPFSLPWSRRIRSQVQSMFSTAGTGCSTSWTSTIRNGAATVWPNTRYWNGRTD